MAFNMRNRSLLSLMHHTTRELNYLLDLSRDLKRVEKAEMDTSDLCRVIVNDTSRRHFSHAFDADLFFNFALHATIKHIVTAAVSFWVYVTADTDG